MAVSNSIVLTWTAVVDSSEVLLSLPSRAVSYTHLTLFAVPSLVSESWFYYCLYHLTILFYHLAHNYCVSTRKYSAIASTVHAWPLVDICYLEQKKQNIFSILSIMRNAAAASLVPSNCLARFKKSFLPRCV